MYENTDIIIDLIVTTVIQYLWCGAISRLIIIGIFYQVHAKCIYTTIIPFISSMSRSPSEDLAVSFALDDDGIGKLQINNNIKTI